MPLSDILPVVAVAARFPPTIDAARFNAASLTTVALPDPFVVRATVPSTARLSRLMTPLLASVMAARLPPTVSVPLSVIPDVFPLVKLRSPSIVDAARIRAVVPLSMVTSASVPESSFVVMVTAPVRALVLLRTIVALFALVVKAEVPATVTLPLSVILPVVAVALKAPPTVDAARFNAASLTTVALPDPFVVRATVPSTARLSRLMTPLLASVMAARLPPTVSVPLSVIPDA